MTETSELVLLAGSTAGAAALAGALVLRVLRTRSLGTQVAAVAVTAVAAIGVGVWVGARAMFLSEHDLWALGVILTAAGIVGIGSALVLGRRVGAASDALVTMARDLGAGGSLHAPDRSTPQELARLHRELEHTSRRLDEARAREQTLDASRRELVAWVSHDLRTPLAGIRAIVEALEDHLVEDPETVGRYYSTLRREADRLAELVDDLFELSRAQAGMLHREPQRVSLRDIVSDALAGISPVAASKGVQLQGTLNGAAPELEISTSEVLRALRNILENAVRHTPRRGTVTVDAGSDGKHAYVSIIDCGGGIPARDLARVFDVGFCGQAARTPGEGGGLGLAIARGFVEAHHGSITVRNENGGCRFTVQLPVAEPSLT